MTQDLPKHARQDPKGILEALLDASGTAIMAGDFPGFLDCFVLPQEMETFEGRSQVETPEQFRQIFDAVRRFHLRAAVTSMIRHCVEAEYRDDDTIEATHESRLLSGQRLIQRPYPVFSVLKRVEGVWKISASQYAIADSPDLNKALHAGTRPL